jgi:hypothetical protein
VHLDGERRARPPARRCCRGWRARGCGAGS